MPGNNRKRGVSWTVDSRSGQTHLEIIGIDRKALTKQISAPLRRFVNASATLPQPEGRGFAFDTPQNLCYKCHQQPYR